MESVPDFKEGQQRPYFSVGRVQPCPQTTIRVKNSFSSVACVTFHGLAPTGLLSAYHSPTNCTLCSKDPAILSGLQLLEQSELSYPVRFLPLFRMAFFTPSSSDELLFPFTPQLQCFLLQEASCECQSRLDGFPCGQMILITQYCNCLFNSPHPSLN